MEPTVFVVAATAITMGLVHLATAGWRRARIAAWRKAAETAGLTAIDESNGVLSAPQVSGRSGPLRVRLIDYREGKQKRGTTLFVDGLGQGSGALTLRRESFLDRALGSEIEIGAPAFDDELYVKSDLTLALAILHAKNRRRLATLLKGSLEVAGHGTVEVHARLAEGVLAVSLPQRGPDNGRLAAVITALLDLARGLVAPPDLARRIGENLRREPAEGVRLKALQVLTGEFPDHPATGEALHAALKDPSDDVRLSAALLLGDEGCDTLIGLVTSPGTEDGCAARAIEALGLRLPREAAEDALRRALKWKRGETAVASLEALGRLGADDALLLQGLASGDPQVVLAAVRVLGQAGTAAVVPALRKVETESRGDLRGAARQAVAAIQSRLAGAARGQLSLTGSAAGSLSLAAAEPGQLSYFEGAPDHADSTAGGETAPPRTAGAEPASAEPLRG
jgi:HEAT repeat protein